MLSVHAAAISHHYDVGNDFYRLLLDESMTYSCAYWVHDPSPAYTLADAQADKYELICRKLGLRVGVRLLDVGCGWGGMLLHAATRHGVSGVGITLSKEQAALAGQRISDAGVADRIEVRLCDGELLPVGEVVSAIENAGFEVRDVESLRENYYLTLLQWLANLHRSRDRAIKLVGAEQVRTCELYIAGSAAAFGAGRLGIHQTLAVKPVAGDSGLARIRAQWLCG